MGSIYLFNLNITRSNLVLNYEAQGDQVSNL
jgi:hypothetical protein